jgi:hypothetical protein
VRAEWERWWGGTDSQEVGLEAAILERVRNSSLVECPCADNVTGLKRAPEAAAGPSGHGAWCASGWGRGRGAFGSEGVTPLVEQRSPARERGWSGPKCECRNE